MAGYSNDVYRRIADAGTLTNKTKAANRDPSSNGYVDQGGFNTAAGSNEARIQNAGRAATNFYAREGGRLTDPYEAKEQERRMMTSADRMKYADARSPQQLLQDRMGSEAYANRKGLLDDKREAGDVIKSQAGSALTSGLKATREGSNSRGLLYSGMRQGAEQDLKGRVANTMAGQLSGSNAELSNRADTYDRVAASISLQNAEAQQAAIRETNKMKQENDVMRAQQMQQLSQGVGYAFGRYAGGGGDTPQNPNVVSKQHYVP